ncbi:hypothetical protein [Streptomyces sp. NRRL F-5727]|uniref:hypothetical protein n=1 Tax=Streptomyces sp. NRRL F-5727 TaxID=1463871 RepID=UPI0004C95AA5|nr:hypothetical protein [Streptomyces sp. NRRL F-5727]
MDPWWLPLLLWVVLVSGAGLLLAAPLVSRWTNRLLLLTAIVTWCVLAVNVSMAAATTTGSRTIDVSVADGLGVTTGCLLDHGVLCLGPQKDLAYPFSPGIVTWIVLGALLVGFVRLLEIRNARGDSIAIEVDDLIYANPGSDGDSPGAAGRHAATCTAKMRTILATQVQTPPPLPGGEPVLSLPTVLYEAKPKDGDLVTKLLALAWQSAFPERGWRLTGHVQQSGEGFGVTVNMTEKSTHRSVLQDTYWEETEEEAVHKAAYTVAQLAVASTVGIPRWTKWRAKNGRGLRHYRDGVDLLRNGGEKDRAAREFSAAVNLDPSNGLARSELGLLKEGTPEGYLQALEIYLGLITAYPAMAQPRYRAGIVLDLVDEWLDAWLADPAWQKRLDRALTGARLPAATGPDGEVSRRAAREHFLDASLHVLTSLRADLDTVPLIRGWWATETRGLYRELIRPAGSLRGQTRAAVDAAILARGLHVRFDRGAHVPSLQDLRKDGSDFAECEERLRTACGYDRSRRYRAASARSTSDGEAQGRIQIAGLVQYNAACFYARLIGPPPGDGDGDGGWAGRTEEAAALALDHLTASMRNSELLDDWFDSLEGDPDLRHLRGHPEFREWALTRQTGADTRGGDGHDRREVGAAARSGV